MGESTSKAFTTLDKKDDCTGKKPDFTLQSASLFRAKTGSCQHFVMRFVACRNPWRLLGKGMTCFISLYSTFYKLCSRTGTIFHLLRTMFLWQQSKQILSFLRLHQFIDPPVQPPESRIGQPLPISPPLPSIVET